MVGWIEIFIPYGVVASQIAGVCLLVGLIVWKAQKKSNAVVEFAGKNATGLAFLLLLAAVSGSLFYSYVLGYEPCILCWYQRIFIYSQLFLFGTALWIQRRDSQEADSPRKTVFVYSLVLSVIGGLIAVYQILLPYLEKAGLGGCASTTVSCTKLYVYEFGYLTIPVMSLSVFVILILLRFANNIKNQN